MDGVLLALGFVFAVSIAIAAGSAVAALTPKPHTVLAVRIQQPAEPDVRQVEVERGDTLTGILADEGVDGATVKAAVAALSSVYDVSGIRAGQIVTLTFSPDGTSLVSAALKPSVERDVAVRRNADGSYSADEKIKTLTARDVHAHGVIDGSLFVSAKAAGVPDAVIVDLIHIYSYDVDFQREVKSGDRFDVLYTTYVDENGEPLKGGAVQYAELTLGREKKPLYRFTTQDDNVTDYYTPKGWSGKRQLMRTPVDGARISSSYGMRFHPILGYTKMHKGVDFAAPIGTPVMASGNGVVKMARWNGGYGNFIELAHVNAYATGYGHLSRFARGIRPGVRVRQGQIIAYVGSTGRSTGPHLHYEVLLKERQIDPMGVKLPTGRELTGRDLIAFKANIGQVQQALGNTTSLVAQVRASLP